ncbi:MAG: tyrosine-type recombinase/integrase, partial [Roseburia sp.]
MSKTRRNGEGSIRKRSDNCWEVRVSGGIDFATGKPIRISRYAGSEEEAVRLLHQLSFQYGSNQSKISNMTLGEWLDLWLAVYMRHSLKQSTYNSYDSYAKNHFKPALGNVRLSDLTTRMLQQLYNYKLEHEGLSSKTIRNLNLYLHKALGQAQTEGLILTNPAEGIILPRAAKPQIEILTRDEQARLVQASYQHRYGVFVRLVLATGLRLGELLGLQWCDIDFRTNILHVQRTLNRLQKRDTPTDASPRTEIVIQEPKSENSIRSVPLLAPVISDLLNWRRVQETDQATVEGYVESGFIVTNPMGGYIEPRTFSDYYGQILNLAGLRHFTFHALRHTFASRAMEQGMDEKTLSTILGHYSVSFTLDTYAHVLDEHLHQEMGRMEELFHIEQMTPQNLAYPVLVTAGSDGYTFQCPDFPELQFNYPSVEAGAAAVTAALRDAVVAMQFPP